MQPDLFLLDSGAEYPASEPRFLPIDHGELILFHGVFDAPEQLFERLRQEVPWQQDHLRMGSRAVAIPRLQSWHGAPHCVYSYSRLRLEPRPMLPLLQSLQERIRQLAGAPFNCVLCNFYRNGQDSVSWHADDEPELGPNPQIASVSFGGTRRFQLRRRGQTRAEIQLELPDNSLLIMRGALQHHWQHQVPKTAQATARINLTFRYIAP